MQSESRTREAAGRGKCPAAKQRDAAGMGITRLWGQDKVSWAELEGREPEVRQGVDSETGRHGHGFTTTDGFPQCLSVMVSAELILSRGKGTGEIPSPGPFFHSSPEKV